jgi:hypothetical protein
MRKFLAVAAIVVAAPFAAHPALALDPYDTPSISCEGATENSIQLRVCGGANTGAPAGISIHWMKLEDYLANGSQWASSESGLLCELSLSGQPSLQHPDKSRWELLAGECETIWIGDINFDETGVSGHGCGLDYLECGTEYVFRVFAHAGRRMGRSDWSETIVCSTLPCPVDECTYTQGYWKTHGPIPTGNNANEWQLTTITLGTVNYTQLQAQSIMDTPASGNGLIALAHQLIAAKLNVALGADCSEAATLIAQADALIGNRVVPPVGTGSLSNATTSSLNNQLTAFNEGVLSGCPAHCGQSLRDKENNVRWGGLKTRYR